MKIGIDIEDISRFKNLDFESNKGFYNRVFTENEIKYCLGKSNPSEHFAVRFCAKESFIKAIDTKIDYKDIEIFNENNKPRIEVRGFNSTLSLTHDKDKAVAVVIVEEKELLKPNFNYIITGRFFILRPISINEINNEYVGWLNSPKINTYLEVRHKKQTIENIYEYINGLRKSKGEVFGVFTKENKFVGTATLNLDSDNLVGMFGLMIGSLDAQRIGAGTETTILFLEFVFNCTKIRKIEGGVIDGNSNSISNLEKLGFKKEGTYRKKHILSGGEIKDGFIYGILKNEWKNEFIDNIEIREESETTSQSNLKDWTED